jgi:hypothetical protein
MMDSVANSVQRVRSVYCGSVFGEVLLVSSGQCDLAECTYEYKERSKGNEHRLATSMYKEICVVRFEVFTAATMKNGVFWDVTPCGSCKNRRFGRT